MKLALQLVQRFCLPLPRREERREVVQRGEKLDDVTAYLSRFRHSPLHVLRLQQLLLIPGLESIAVEKEIDGAGRGTLEMMVEVDSLLAEHVPLAQDIEQ